MNKFIASEAEEQTALFEWVEIASSKYTELKSLYHIPNEGKRSVQSGASLKRQGLKRGVPDICLPCSNGIYNALYIELKSKKGTPTKEQLDWQVLLTKLGNCCVVSYGWEEAVKEIEAYLENRYIFRRIKETEKL